MHARMLTRHREFHYKRITIYCIYMHFDDFDGHCFSLLSCLYGATAQVTFIDTTVSEDLSAVQADEDSTLIIEDTAFAGFVGQVCWRKRGFCTLHVVKPAEMKDGRNWYKRQRSAGGHTIPTVSRAGRRCLFAKFECSFPQFFLCQPFVKRDILPKCS